MMEAKLVRTGKIVPFTDIEIGAPFFYHERFWTRSDRWSGTDLAVGSDQKGCMGACTFTVDKTTDEAVGSEDYWLERSVGLDVEIVVLEMA